MPASLFSSVRQAAAGAGFFILAAMGPQAALAAMNDEIVMADQIVRDAVIKLDALKAADSRTGLLKDAVEAIGVLDRLAADPIGNESARQALADLEKQAITVDVLRLSLIEALGAGIGPGADGLKRDLDAKAMIEGIKDAAYRSAAWTQLARAHMNAGQEAEAERLATRAVEEARHIERRQTRDGALRAAVLVFPASEARPGIIEIATNAMTTANARSEILRLKALAALSRDRKLSRDDLADIAKEALSGDRYAQALQAAQAMERDDDRRADLLDTLFKTALENGDEKLGVQVAKSMSRDRDQNRALRKLVGLRLERDRPIRAMEFVPLMLTDNARNDAQIAIATALDREGYRQAALDILTALTVSPTDDADSAAELVAAFGKLGLHDKAEALAERIIDKKERSFAYSRLSKSYAEDGKLEQAEALLPQVTDEEDLSFARSALSKALLKTKGPEAVQPILQSMPAGEGRDEVLEDLARFDAKAGRIDELRKSLSEVTTTGARSRILITLALALDETDHAAASAALKQAQDLFKDQDAPRDLADIAVAYAQIGDMPRADTILEGISDSKLRDVTARRIAEFLVQKGALDDAKSRLAGLSEESRPEMLAAIALAQFKQDGKVDTLISAVHDLPHTIRVPALRQMAEARARLLDKKNWLTNPAIDPLAVEYKPDVLQKANFLVGQHIVQAPAPSTRSTDGIRMPDIFSLDTAAMRAKAPSPSRGVAHLAILGFSPFSLEAFKLTSGGTAAIHQVQISQQLTWPHYIAVEGGVVTLGELMRDLPETTSRNLLVDKGDVLLVRVPIIVLPGATLLLSGKEFSQYQLGAQSGAFLAVAGKLVVQDADLVGYDEQTNAPAKATEATKANFRPFITGWGGSDLQIAGSRLAMLGYDSSKAFGVTQSSGAAVQSLYTLEENRPKGNLIDNTFENLRYGYYSYEATDVQLIGNEYRDNIVYGIDPHDRSHNLLIALNTAYGSQKKHGIIVSREVDDSFIVGNVSVWNKGSGLMLDRTSRRNVVYANTGMANSGDGLTFYESGCNIAVANEFSGNKRAGIKVRNSTDVGVYDNQIHGNRINGADVYVSDLRQSPEGRSRNFDLDPYQPISSTVISGNSFTGNGNAINVAGALETILEGNSFRDQRSYIYGGDLRPLAPYLLQIGESSAMLVGMACQPQPKVDECRFGDLMRLERPNVMCTGMSPPANGAVTGGVANNG
ncbi:right-handed parallel beta-helix repeat-containing protein [Aliirhizobium terrae]|uniref:NosD domain-containing protein n=1 Tax=Terrirhizobium terrae TaxID=2926709 RepID=UPI00257582A0|nr:NosD domain-containing protein [Rhizobium sp. CC-CFT758]WJH41123.1 right-handed parallel beta-helix repeat-containing protein [Rhizobium sp. CC-CFT758]